MRKSALQFSARQVQFIATRPANIAGCFDSIFEEIEFNYIPNNGETFIELFEQENDGWWLDAWEYLVYDYTAWQKKIVSVFKEHIQPVIRQMV